MTKKNVFKNQQFNTQVHNQTDNENLFDHKERHLKRKHMLWVQT